MSTRKTDAAKLRRRAEKRTPGRSRAAGGENAAEMGRLIHELRVHQIELEMQNEELREAQQRLAASRDHYAAFYDLAPAGYVTLDAGGIMREVNLTTSTMLGVPRARLIGRPFHPFVAAEDLAQFLPHLRRPSVSGGRVGTEFRIVRKGGGPLPVVMQTVPAGDGEGPGQLRRGTITDISALRRAEEALREERDFTAAVLDTSGALILAMSPDGRVLRFNRACEELTGYAAAEIAGKPFWDLLVPPEEIAERRRIIDRLCRMRVPSRSENHLITKSGERRLISWANSVLADGDGKMKAIIASGLDITDQRRLESEMLQIIDREQQRIGIELHDDLGQKLAGMTLMCLALKRRLAGQPAREGEAATLAGLLRDAVRQTRILSHGLAPLKLSASDLIDTLAELALNSTAASGIQCSVRCPARFSIGDSGVAAHLFRIAQEAVNNAITHGRPDKIEIALRRGGSHVRLRISDNGSGFPASRKPGAGMGLEVMKYRANLIGGTFAIRSEPGKGVSVECAIPLGRISIK